jgi:hypothetical protein
MNFQALDERWPEISIRGSSRQLANSHHLRGFPLPVHFVHRDDIPRLGVSERNCSDILTHNNQVRLHRAATPPTSMEGRKSAPRGRMIQTVHYLSVESPPLTLLMIRQTSSLSEGPIWDPLTERALTLAQCALGATLSRCRFRFRTSTIRWSSHSDGLVDSFSKQ